MSVRAATPAPVAAAGEPASPASGLLPALVVTTVSLHLLLAGVLGFGLGDDSSLRVRPEEKAIPPTTLEQPVQLAPPPPEEKPLETPPPDQLPPALSAPVLDDLALPPLPELTPVTAVPASVPVAFPIPVKGPVRLTNDPARATGGVGGRSGPVSIDADGKLAGNLILPPLSYPAFALQRRISGTVEVEFQTAGDRRIAEVRVRRSSGSGALDSAALQNLREGRWLGSPGYYVKTFVFTLR